MKFCVEIVLVYIEEVKKKVVGVAVILAKYVHGKTVA